MANELPPGTAEVQFCYLTTRGRRSGKPHEIEIWFGLRDSTLYLMSGGAEKSDWVRNLRAEPRVSIRIEDRTYAGKARAVEGLDEDEFVRTTLVEKYQPGYANDLTDWRAKSLPIAIELEV